MDYADLQKKYDSIEMIKLIDAWPDHLKKAFELGKAVELSPEFKSAKHIVGLGMGGSGMAYTILSVMMRSAGKASLEVVSDYDLPPYVTKENGTAVCVTSFSGNTEETLSAAAQALERGCPIVCITTGGKLAEWAKEHNLPLVLFEYPVALPRVALSYTFGVALGVFNKAELLSLDVANGHQDRAALNELKQQGQSIAELLHGKMVYVVGSGWSFPMSVRWKGQLNENAKHIAFAEMMPEMCHNMYLGYDLPESIRKNSAVIFLNTAADHPQNLKRAKLVGMDLAETGVTIIHPKVTDALSQVETFIVQAMLGDYVSYYLALLNHKDPAEMERIESLKKRL